MYNKSIGLTQYLMIDILISNLKVTRTIIGYETYINKHHHVLSSHLLAKKWGTGLDKVKHTLESTTQEIVR